MDVCGGRYAVRLKSIRTVGGTDQGRGQEEEIGRGGRREKDIESKDSDDDDEARGLRPEVAE